MGLPRGRRTPCHQYQLREIRETLLPISKRAFRKITSSNRSSPLNPDAPCFKPSTSLNPNVSNNPLNNSQIKILSTNARSLLPNMTELQMITNALQPDIIAVTRRRHGYQSLSLTTYLPFPMGAIHKMAPTLGDSSAARALRGNFYGQPGLLAGLPHLAKHFCPGFLVLLPVKKPHTIKRKSFRLDTSFSSQC